jgi:D-threo-aldose 1-dehydrogenase
MPKNFGYEVSADQAHATVRAVFDSPVNFLDTSNGYSDGASEERIGAVIAERGGLPEGFVLATKVDPDRKTRDFSAERVRRSVEESLERLRLERFALLFLHDPENVPYDEAVGPGGCVEGMVAVKEAGLAERIGVAGGPIRLMTDLLGLGMFEVVLTHNRYTLVDRSAEPLLEMASAAGIGIINAAVYGGGILARGPSHTDRYAYRPASPVTLERIREMERRCEARGISLRAAALHFSLREPRIASTVVGVSSPEHVADLVALATTELPPDLFDELAPFAAPEESWLG